MFLFSLKDLSCLKYILKRGFSIVAYLLQDLTEFDTPSSSAEDVTVMIMFVLSIRRFDKISFAEHIAAALSPRCLREEESLKDFALSHIDFIRGKCQEITAPEDSDEESDWDSPFFSKKPKTHDCGIAEFMASGTTHEDLLKSKCLTRLFKTYNIPLATSASIERAFSQARRTLTFQRSRLGDRLFNAIAVLRATKPLNL